MSSFDAATVGLQITISLAVPTPTEFCKIVNVGFFFSTSNLLVDDFSNFLSSITYFNKINLLFMLRNCMSLREIIQYR